MRSIVFVFLFALVFTIPMEEVVTIEGVGSICRLIGYLAILTGILAVVASGSARSPHRIHYVMVPFFIWLWFSLMWTVDINRSTMRSLTF